MTLSRSLTSALALAASLLASLPATAEMTLAPGTSVTFHHHDLLGSPVMVSDHKGRVLWYENTKPYGEGVGKKSSSGLGHLDNFVNEATSNLGYTGHTVDSSTGLVYMKARHYDPVIGRFYSNDPVGALRHLNTLNGLQGFNRYAYANNNPYTYTDPDGEATAVGAGIAGTIVCGPVCGAIAFISTAAGTGYVLSEITGDESNEGPIEEDWEVDGELEGEAQYDSSTDPKLEAGPPTEKQLKKFQKQLDEHGLSSLENSRDSIQKNLDEHLAKLEEYRSAGGYTSSVEREIRNFKRELEAVDNVLENSD